MKTPLTLPDGSEILYEIFTNQETEHVVAIEDQTYRIRYDGTRHYVMLRIGRHQRTIRGSLDEMIRKVCQMHTIYRRYETRVRRLKEDAQRKRDHELNGLLESP